MHVKLVFGWDQIHKTVQDFPCSQTWAADTPSRSDTSIVQSFCLCFVHVLEPDFLAIEPILNQPSGTIETLLVFELLNLFIPPVDRATPLPVARSPVCFRRWKMRKNHASNRLLGLKLLKLRKIHMKLVSWHFMQCKSRISLFFWFFHTDLSRATVIPPTNKCEG